MILELGRSPGREHDNPLQCSCLENPRDGGASWAAVYGVAQSWTRLKQLSRSSSHFLYPRHIPHRSACIPGGIHTGSWLVPTFISCPGSYPTVTQDVNTRGTGESTHSPVYFFATSWESTIISKLKKIFFKGQRKNIKEGKRKNCKVFCNNSKEK